MTAGRLRPTLTNPRSPAERAEDLVTSSLLGTPVHVDIVVPRTTVKAKMRLATRAERFEAEAETRRVLQAAGFPVDATAVSALGAHDQWQYELGARILAVAVRDPGAPECPLAPLEEWRQCDDDQLDALWDRYEDLEAELDPLGTGPGLTKEERTALIAAAKKGDASLLMSYGSRKLALFAISSAEEPASSPTPPS